MRKLFHIKMVLIFTTVFCYQSVLAEMYKWVDENGNTQYSQHPPPDGIEADVLKKPPKVDTQNAIKDLEATQKRLDEISSKRTEEMKSGQKEQEHAALIEENCKKAKAKLENNQNTGRIRAVDEEGNVIRASEEERQRRIKSAQEAVDKWCNR